MDDAQRLVPPPLGHDPNINTNLPNRLDRNDDQRENQQRPLQTLYGTEREVAVRSRSMEKHR